MKIRVVQVSLLSVDLVTEAIPGMAPTKWHTICQPRMSTHRVGWGYTYQFDQSLGLRIQYQRSHPSDTLGCLLCGFGLAQEARERKGELGNEIWG